MKAPTVISLSHKGMWAERSPPIDEAGRAGHLLQAKWWQKADLRYRVTLPLWLEFAA